MRACKDCKHFYPVTTQGRYVCRRFMQEFETGFDPVWGPRTNFAAPDCSVARAEGGQCGPKGRNWEPRYGTPEYDEWAMEQARKAVAESVEETGPVDARPLPWWKRVMQFLQRGNVNG